MSDDLSERPDRDDSGRPGKISHYRILDELGAGGMGVVYRARDERLMREVAVKVLPAGRLGEERARERFRREAVALAKLNHPNIAAVFDFGTEQDVDYLVMELVEGTSLDDLLRSGPLPGDEVGRLGIQLAQGLRAAHEAGIVHRDLKPSNLRITGDGRLKILDFGLVKLVKSPSEEMSLKTLTAPQAMVGTVPYMAPEQLLGEPVDNRTDIYAAGTVLYEMATGYRPFQERRGSALIDAIISDTPLAPTLVSEDLTLELEEVILKAMAKNPDDRYASADVLLAALERVSGSSQDKSRALPSHPRRRAWWIGALALATIGIIAAFLVRYLPRQVKLRSMAILPLANETGDKNLEYIIDGLTEGLINRLVQVKGLKIIARDSVFRYKGQPVDLQKVGNELGVEVILTGRVRRGGGALEVTAELVSTGDRRQVWGTRIPIAAAALAAVEERLAKALILKIRPELGIERQRRVAKDGTTNAEARRIYLRAQYLLSRYTSDNLRKAIGLFRQAIELEPMYALAHAGLADAYYHLSELILPPREAMPRAAAAARKALELDPDLARAHVLLGMVSALYERRWSDAERSFVKALELNPGYALAYHYYGLMLTFRGRFADAKRHLARARELDPLSKSIAVTAIYPLYFNRRHDQALERLKTVKVLHPGFVPALWLEGWIHGSQGRYPEAIRALRAAQRQHASPALAADIAWVRAARGQRKEAAAALKRLAELAKTKYVPSYNIALVHAKLGNLDEAFRWLEIGAKERSEGLNLLQVDPRADPLRADPRLAALLRRIGI